MASFGGSVLIDIIYNGGHIIRLRKNCTFMHLVHSVLLAVT